jgi:hypothetical protein
LALQGKVSQGRDPSDRLAETGQVAGEFVRQNVPFLVLQQPGRILKQRPVRTRAESVFENLADRAGQDLELLRIQGREPQQEIAGQDRSEDRSAQIARSNARDLPQEPARRAPVVRDADHNREILEVPLEPAKRGEAPPAQVRLASENTRKAGSSAEHDQPHRLGGVSVKLVQDPAKDRSGRAPRAVPLQDQMHDLLQDRLSRDEIQIPEILGKKAQSTGGWRHGTGRGSPNLARL